MIFFYWSFLEKTCEAKHEMESVFKFSDVLFALGHMDHPIVEVSDEVDIFVRSSGQADVWSDVPPVETSCGLVCNYFGQDDLWSDVPPQ